VPTPELKPDHESVQACCTALVQFDRHSVTRETAVRFAFSFHFAAIALLRIGWGAGGRSADEVLREIRGGARVRFRSGSCIRQDPSPYGGAASKTSHGMMVSGVALKSMFFTGQMSPVA
jgi:hypothetical protein